jgi:hypothetical protein
MLRAAVLLLVGWVLGGAALKAYPPAPYYTLFGVVRDQVGATLRVDGAEIVLLRDGKEIGRTPIYPDLRLDSNYELKIRIDQGHTGTRVYSTSALQPQGVYSLLVVINGQNLYPIEVSGTLRAGTGGERVRLDLNLGGDANRDGLPDAWQEWVLYQAGRRPGTPEWNINLITKDGDFDGDGISNFLEYVAGTFAGDPAERLELSLINKTPAAVFLEFYSITGKVYGIEESADLKTWQPTPFTVGSGSPPAILHRAQAIGITTAQVAAPATTSRFYRLTVR